MFQLFKDYWWLVLIRGILAVLFGVYTLVYPGMSALSLVLAFGLYAVVYGGMTLGIALFSSASANDRFLVGLEGALQALLGVLVLAWPDITMVSLLAVIIAFAFVSGISELIAAFRYRDLWLGLSGAIAILFGIYALRFPGDGALAVLFGIGFYAVLVGISLIIGSFQIRKVGKTFSPSAS